MKDMAYRKQQFFLAKRRYCCVLKVQDLLHELIKMIG